MNTVHYNAAMSSPSSPARGRPARIDQARTVATALELLDESGLDALTMRRLATALDVQAGALYRYFATKQDLLTAMAERMLAGVAAVPASAPGGDWGEQLTGLAGALRGALLSYRDGARVFAGTYATGASVLGFADTVVGVLRGAGFGDEEAARALLAVANFTVGHTLEEQAARQPADGPGAPERSADPERLRRAVAEGEFEQLAAVLPTLTESDFTTHFAFGLHLLVEGLRAVRAAGGPSGG